MALNCTARALVAAQVRTMRVVGTLNSRAFAFTESMTSAKSISLRNRRLSTSIVTASAETEVAGKQSI